MGIWPFRRRSKRRKSIGGAELPQSSEMHDVEGRLDPAGHNEPDLASTVPERRKSRRDTKRKSSGESKKLQRDPGRRRTYSFSPGRQDSIRVARDENRPPVPPIPAYIKGKPRAKTDGPEPVKAGSTPHRSNTQAEDTTEDWLRMPTLRKRSPADVARRKSSKKRKEEHDRENEIKAMVAFLPTRPAADVTSSGRPLRRESKKMRAGFNRRLENPSSDVSLPLTSSLRSSVSSHSDFQTAYKLSAFEALSPRPTIKYAENPRYAPLVPKRGSDASGSRKRKVADRVTMDEETLKANKRVDNLADDLSASELRELMERDKKRKEKKKIADMIKMEKRLARRQEKQRAEEAAAFRDGTPPPVNMERGVLGREVVGLGIGTSAIITSSKRKGSVGSDDGRGKRPGDAFRPEASASAPSPLSEFRRPSLDNASPISYGSEHIIETAKIGKVSKATVSPPQSPRLHKRGASSLSQMMDLNKPETFTPAPIPQASRQATESTRQSGSWTSFFKLPGRNRRSPAPHPSFSNTSRDSMPRDQVPPMSYQPMRSTSSIPRRTMSKFREDLPELPVSPPDSRVQSPEADVVPPIKSGYPDKRGGKSSEDPRIRYDTPTSGYRSLDTMRIQDETPTSGHHTVEAPSPEPSAVLSRSLASIDSEGSWLSGRRAGSKRVSSQKNPHRSYNDSSSSLNRRYKDFSESAEEVGIAEDEYFNRLTPGPEEQNMNRKSTGQAMPSSDEEEGGGLASPPSDGTKWGAVPRHTAVVHRQTHAKSTEGLLNQFDDDSEVETPTSANKESFQEKGSNEDSPEPGVHRATSVDLGKHHVRHISAGSARLLNLKPRASGEAKRMSTGSGRELLSSSSGRELTPAFI